MLATTGSPCWRASFISARWPACRLPMVGTNDTRFCPRKWSRNSWMVWTTFKGISETACSPRAASGGGSYAGVRQAHINGRVGLGLGDFQQRFARQFEHGDEMYHHHRHRRAFADAFHEQLAELDETHIVQAAQDVSHVVAHRQLFARDVVMLVQLGALQDIGPRGAQVVDADI